MPRPKHTPWNRGHVDTPKAIGIRARYRKAQEKKAETEPKEQK